jgi:viral A-type inclusion protein
LENSKLKELKERYEDAKGKVIRSSASKEQLEQNLASTIKEIKSLGIDPENLDSELEALKEEVGSLYEKIENNLDKVDSIAEEIKKG